LIIGFRYRNKRRQKVQNIQTADMKLDQTNYIGINVNNNVQPSRVNQSKELLTWTLSYSDIIIGDKIGQGNFGVVYRGQYRSGKVAVKMILQGFSQDQFDDFMNEVNTMGSIRPHSNVVQFQGYCIHKDQVMLVTELCEGGSLYSLISSNMPMNRALVMKIIKGSASGIHHLHKEGIIHRDLAARNILLTASLDPKVSDFGMSRILDNTEDNPQKTEATVGPVKWMSPELLKHRLYSEKSDAWSFGVIIYEVASRKGPYATYSPIQVSIGVATREITLEPSPNYPELGILQRKCMQYEPKDRPNFTEICGILADIA